MPFKNSPIAVALLAAILFIPFLGQVHLFDWDEVNFAESAREMLVTGDYFRVQINYLPFWEKPPLFFWLQAASMSIFGINEFAARFPNAVCGILTLSLLFYIGKRTFSSRFAWLWVLFMHLPRPYILKVVSSTPGLTSLSFLPSGN
jgi:4-amino-4-deoxy-L-arabinose transferase-like glycosyltransferase